MAAMTATLSPAETSPPLFPQMRGLRRCTATRTSPNSPCASSPTRVAGCGRLPRTVAAAWENKTARCDSSKAQNASTGAATSIFSVIRRVAAASLVAMQVAAPIPIYLTLPTLPSMDPNQINFSSAPNAATQVFTAQAVLLSPDTKVPKNAEVALRRAVPVVNANLRKIQDGLEEIFVLLRIPQRKPYGTMESNIKKAQALLEQSKNELVAASPADKQEEARRLVDKIVGSEKDGLTGLLKAVSAQDADKVSLRLFATLDSVTQLAILQAPGLQFLIPAQYASYPRLTGRAVVELTVLKGDGSSFSIKNGAESTKTGKLLVVLDGYSAPITAGNFAKLVTERQYDGVAVKATDMVVISDARDMERIAQNAPGDIPLELMPAGEFQPVYRTPLDVTDGELPVLPMSVFGAVVMSHSPQSDNLSSPSQFFFYRYDKRNSGLGGLAFDEGQFSVFGYLTSGKEILSQLRTGDVIQSAQLVSGSDRLVVPASQAAAVDQL